MRSVMSSCSGDQAREREWCEGPARPGMGHARSTDSPSPSSRHVLSSVGRFRAIITRSSTMKPDRKATPGINKWCSACSQSAGTKDEAAD